MNKVKSAYVMIFMLSMVAITAIAAIRLTTDNFVLGYVGVLLTTVPFILFITRVMALKNTPRTSSRLPILTLLAIIGMVVAIYDFVNGAGQVLPLGLSLAGACLFFGYNFWYSTLGRVPSPYLTLGNPLPDFPVEDTEGHQISSASFAGHSTILLFYRGNWCPLCMAQIKEIAGEYHQLSDLGARVVLISPQPHGHSKNLAKQFDVPFDFMVDPGNQAAIQLGIDMKDGLPLGMAVQGYDSDTVLPTVVITDAKGTIIFVDQTDNYRVRPEPATFLAALEKAGVAAHAT